MFRVKICGITNVEDAVAAVEAGADAIGLNFYEGSKRFVDAGLARQIADAVAGKVDVVGVFVNAPNRKIIEAITEDQVKLDMVQTHGDESPEEFLHLRQSLYLIEFAERTARREFELIRVRRLTPNGLRTLVIDLRACQALMALPSALLVDAAAPGEYGGTGAQADWNALAMHETWLGKMPLILAGGLTPDNVAEAIRIVRPAAVDVASGVESSSGKKDPAKVHDFVAAARAAFDALGERGA